MNNSQANTLHLFIQPQTTSENGPLIAEVIEIARSFPSDALSKRAIIHLSNLDGLQVDFNDPVAQYVSHFGVNTSSDKFQGRLHALHGILMTTLGKTHSIVA